MRLSTNHFAEAMAQQEFWMGLPKDISSSRATNVFELACVTICSQTFEREESSRIALNSTFN